MRKQMKVNDKKSDAALAPVHVPAHSRPKTRNTAESEKLKLPQSDPFTDALRESMDADSDIERANSGRVRREGVKDDDGVVEHDLNEADEKVRSHTSQNEGRQPPQSKRVQERERLEQAQGTDTRADETLIANQKTSPVQQQSQSILATVSLDSHGTASFLMERSFNELTQILANPAWMRAPDIDGSINIQQMLLSVQ